MKENIPFRHMPWTVQYKLASKLDPDIVGNNWRMLAEKIGYSSPDILVSDNIFKAAKPEFSTGL